MIIGSVSAQIYKVCHFCTHFHFFFYEHFQYFPTGGESVKLGGNFTLIGVIAYD